MPCGIRDTGIRDTGNRDTGIIEPVVIEPEGSKVSELPVELIATVDMPDSTMLSPA
jgi:hypothetical protein